MAMMYSVTVGVCLVFIVSQADIIFPVCVCPSSHFVLHSLITVIALVIHTLRIQAFVSDSMTIQHESV